jgi:ADP-ribosylglycohydrolase/protein-tyrosine phosphatase
MAMLKSRYVTRDRIAGGLVGLLVGDALGVPYEFHPPGRVPPRDQINMQPPDGFPRAHRDTPPGTWSDDGAQALCVLESLLERQGLNLDDFAGRLLRWLDHGHLAVDGRVFDVGIQTSRALVSLRRGDPAESSGPAGERDNGNGALMRVLPLALWHRGTDEELALLAARQSLPTHGHAQSQVCCAWACLWARALLHEQSDPWAWAADTVGRIAQGNRDWLQALDLIHAYGEQPASGSGYVVDTLWSARHALMEGDSFDAVVRAAIALGNDTDTTAAVAGGLAGIRHGLYGIPQAWRDCLRGRELYQPLLARLLDIHQAEQFEPSGLVRTSQSHPLKIGTVEMRVAPGRVGITFCPGKTQLSAMTGAWQRDLDIDLQAIRAWGASHLLTLIEAHEVEALGVAALGAKAEVCGMAWHHLPITDGGTPDARFDQQWRDTGPLLLNALKQGQSVVVHCKGGLGRAGIIAARLLVEIGECSAADEAIERVRTARPNAVETAGQEAYLRRLACAS